MMFNFDKAMEAATKQGQFAVDFLTRNRPKFEAMTEEAVLNVLDLMIASKPREAMVAFYGSSWQALADGAAQDVVDTAGLAERAKAVKDMLQSVSIMAAKALLTILAAGFCL